VSKLSPSLFPVESTAKGNQKFHPAGIRQRFHQQ
jgi:hypothetical protein